MHSLIEKLVRKGPVVTDGSWGTQLQRRGLSRGESPDYWNLDHPERVAEVAQAYVDAGSQIILTNTFQASRITLERYGLDDKTREINQRGVQISKSVAKDRALVFASIGSCGKMLITGDTTEAELGEVFGEQATALAEAGADGIVVETMIDVAEAKIAAAAAKQTGLPVVASVVFDAGKNKDMTMMGNSIAEAVETLSGVGVDVIGANCGQGIEAFAPICKRMRQLTDLPIWMKPNAGLPEIVDEQTVFHTTAAEFGAHVPGLLESGANFIGACCGSDETFIAEIRRIVAAATA
jgi:methionine synthase I (cobalamin-dependent)